MPRVLLNTKRLTVMPFEAATVGVPVGTSILVSYSLKSGEAFTDLIVKAGEDYITLGADNRFTMPAQDVNIELFISYRGIEPEQGAVVKLADYVWRSLNGPQAKAIVLGLISYLVRAFDGLLTYFNTLSIDTVLPGHLRILGILMNVPSRLVYTQETQGNQFIFTNTPVTPYDQGFSTADDSEDGGALLFLRPEDLPPGALRPLSPEEYRSLLKAIGSVGVDVFSFVFIDKVLQTFLTDNSWQVYRDPNVAGQIIAKLAKRASYEAYLAQQLLNLVSSAEHAVTIKVPDI